MIADAAYDAVVFSFNGIDTIRSDGSRARCLGEISRILEPGGVFIFSSHNAKVLAIWPQLRTARGRQIPWRIVRALFKSFPLARRTLGSGAYSPGEGYVRDPVHGGMDHYTSTPATMKPQLEAAGFEVIEVIGGHYPDTVPLAFTPWHYYACRKVSAPR
jgi:SAM-dependent methyltransferase